MALQVTVSTVLSLSDNENFREMVQILHCYSEEFASLDDDNLVPYIREYAQEIDKYHEVIKDVPDQVLLSAVMEVIEQLEGF